MLPSTTTVSITAQGTKAAAHRSADAAANEHVTPLPRVALLAGRRFWYNVIS
ncbi:hypothetical protein FC50_GL002242 [Lacticaseibacillus pantheris DSM 15945 = JCM 12539 = NBRC 106106]|uniref:Uncharacterized protein n=1 Tax=Lacticaseibacillus pantheris DSM 15945 = JCM 12539 = NBRC 106106 TaxID=1423783 RepID=A0A0R1TZU2_9LACO|nr:hypothetical protein FC50_GL002242 [Lacticaseibacillus pantheris DSM 15945 = JCM 12539 = NBRC 106106]